MSIITCGRGLDGPGGSCRPGYCKWNAKLIAEEKLIMDPSCPWSFEYAIGEGRAESGWPHLSSGPDRRKEVWEFRNRWVCRCRRPTNWNCPCWACVGADEVSASAGLKWTLRGRCWLEKRGACPIWRCPTAPRIPSPFHHHSSRYRLRPALHRLPPNRRPSPIANYRRPRPVVWSDEMWQHCGSTKEEDAAEELAIGTDWPRPPMDTRPSRLPIFKKRKENSKVQTNLHKFSND